MALNALETAKELISYAVVTDKNGLVKLLERNGIELPNNPSDNEVTVAVLMANQKSGVFRNELKKYLVGLVPDVANYTTELGGNMNFTGTDDFSFTAGDDEFFNATAKAPKIKPTAVKKGNGYHMSDSEGRVIEMQFGDIKLISTKFAKIINRI